MADYRPLDETLFPNAEMGQADTVLWNHAIAKASQPVSATDLDKPRPPAISTLKPDCILEWTHRHSGERMCMRLVRPNDKSLVLEAFQRLSADSIMKRFFTLKTELTKADLCGFTEPQPGDYCCVITVADASLPEGEKIVGIGQYFRLPLKPTWAEVAFLVIDDYQHQGLATRLLKQLLRTAHASGIETFTADTFLNNFGMQALVTHNVRGVRTIRDGSEVTLIIPVHDPTEDKERVDYGQLSPLLTRRSTARDDPAAFVRRRVSLSGAA